MAHKKGRIAQTNLLEISKLICGEIKLIEMNEWTDVEDKSVAVARDDLLATSFDVFRCQKIIES